MSIQKGECVTGRHGGTQEPSSYKSFSLSLAHDSYNVQLLQIIIQLVL